MARMSAEVTHNHPEGVKGAESVASAIWLARNGHAKTQIKNYIQREFGYDLDRKVDDIRETYQFDVTCQGSVPEDLIKKCHKYLPHDMLKVVNKFYKEI